MEKLKIKDIYLKNGITNSFQAELGGIKLKELYEFPDKGSIAKRNFVKQLVEFVGSSD